MKKPGVAPRGAVYWEYQANSTMHMIDETKQITRGEFLTVLGGIGLTVVAAKVSGLTGIADAVKPKARLATTPNSYGNNTYGGTSA